MKICLHVLNEDLLFSSAWLYIGLIGAFLFIIIQLILIVDFAHGWNEKWVDRYEETESKAYCCGKRDMSHIVMPTGTPSDIKCLLFVTLFFHSVIIQ